MDNSYAIKVENIVKQYPTLRALDGVSFTVPKSTVFCILGPNGAGKTTLLRILTTITQPTSGEAWIEGYNLAKQTLSIRGHIGVVAQENRFDKYLSIWHNLTLHAQMHGLPKSLYVPRITESLKQMGLYERRNELSDVLSGGMQRRVALIRALIHEPTLLFLDEPTTGLDPEARLMIWENIERIKHKTTVILTTHYMDEAERLSDSILMLNHGKVVAEGTSQSLKQTLMKMGHYQVMLQGHKAKPYYDKLAVLSDGISDVKMVDDCTIDFTLASPSLLQKVFEQIAPEDLLSIGPAQPDLEDVFLAVAGQGKK